jgi:hypothetical protein
MLQFGVLGGHVAGGEDVGEEEDLVVLHAVRHLQRADVGEGDPGVLGLAAGVAPRHVGVAVEAGRGVAHHLLGDPGVGVRVVAERKHLALAEEATAAGNGEGDDHALADLQVLDAAAELHHLAHELVAEDVPLLHGGDVAVVEMEVRAADRRRGDLHDGVAGVQDLGVGNRLDPHVGFAVPADCSHGVSPGLLGGSVVRFE